MILYNGRGPNVTGPGSYEPVVCGVPGEEVAEVGQGGEGGGQGGGGGCGHGYDG